jgi:selenocysteine lyase/cysteine desulfurase
LSTILFGWLGAGDHVLITPLEHNSVLRPLEELSRTRSVSFDVLPHDSFGRVYPESIKDFVKPNSKLVCCNMVSNVIGSIQPYREVITEASKFGIPVLLDGSQAAGHLEIDLDELGAAFFACPGHKALLGIQGTGLMYIAEGYKVKPLRIGGTGFLSESMRHPEALPQYYEAGTINMPGVRSLAAGLDYIENRGIPDLKKHLESLTDLLLSGLTSIDGVVVYGLSSAFDGHGGSVSFNLSGMAPSEVGRRLAEDFRISNRVGIHCAPLAHEMIGTKNQGGTVRFSVGCFNTKEEIEYSVNAVTQIAKSSI